MNKLLVTPLIFATCLALVGMSGCMVETRVVKENPWNKLFTESEWSDTPSESAGSGRRNSKGYAIELAKFDSRLEFDRARKLMREARAKGGLADIWYSSDARWTRVYAGKFRQPNSDQVKSVLREVQQAKIDGKRVFEDAKVVALGSSQVETLDPHNLRSLSGQGLVSLQVGYFDRTYGTDFRRAAEQTVKDMRKNGEEAYYYHGPHRSLVLINAWTRDEAFFAQTGRMERYSNAVRLVQQKYPYNVPNGRPFTAADDPEFVKTQGSFLVPIR